VVSRVVGYGGGAPKADGRQVDYRERWDRGLWSPGRGFSNYPSLPYPWAPVHHPLPHIPFMCIPSPPSLSGNSSLYDLVWPGRISDTHTLPTYNPDIVAQRTVKFFLSPAWPSISPRLHRTVYKTSIRRPPQGFKPLSAIIVKTGGNGGSIENTPYTRSH